MSHNHLSSMAPLPPPLRTSESGSFAQATIVKRKPEIIRRVLADNDYPLDIVAALEAFRDEIAHHPIAPLTEDAPDVSFWHEHLARYAGKTWLEVPWYFAETYFYPYHQLPPTLRAELTGADLVILKGDVNYRRLLDDRHWSHTTPIQAADAEFPRPYLILRTLKGEILVHLNPGQAETLATQDPTWLTNGKRGLIQVVKV